VKYTFEGSMMAGFLKYDDIKTNVIIAQLFAFHNALVLAFSGKTDMIVR
jgi:hypothetical protein